MEDRTGVAERVTAPARDEGTSLEARSGDDRGRKRGRGRKKGYEIVERNWTCSAGEADIIARDEEWVVFVEVKTRSSCEKGFPSEAVDPEKRKRYENIAALFLRDYDVVDVPVRFDVVSIVLVAPDRAMIRHHINAYSS